MGANRDSLAADAFDDANRVFGSGDALVGALSSLDSTMPPTPLRDLLAADGATIFVLSADPELIHAVERAGGDQFPVHVVASWAALVDAAARRRTHIVLVDADTLPLELPDAVMQLHDVAPLLVVLVAANGDAAQALMSLLSDRSVHRLLIKPAAEGITRLLLESAIGRYLQLRDRYRPPAVLVDDFRPARRYREPRASWSPWLLATALAVAIVGAVVVGELYGVRWRESLDRLLASAPVVESRSLISASAPSDDVARPSGFDQPPSVREPIGGTEPAADESVRPASGPSIDSEAPAAFHVANDQHIDPPVEDAPAVSSPLPTEPHDATQRSVPEQRETVERFTFEQREGAEPPLPGERNAAEQSADGGADPPRTELEIRLDLVRARLADGRLFTSGGDGAMEHFERAVELSPHDPRVLASRTAIAAGFVDAAGVALERGNLDEAQRFAAEAFRLGADRLALARLDRDLEAVRRARTLDRHTELLSTASAATRAGRLVGANGEGAIESLAALRRERSTLPGVAAAWRDVTDAVSRNVRVAIDAGDFAAARKWAAALAVDGGDPRLASELEFEARQAEFLARPVASTELQLLEAPLPVYPTDARAAEVEGWVDLEFVVDRQGRTRDIVVVDSQPGRRFVDASIDAVAGQRYVPFLLNRRVYERRVQVRVRFDLR